MAADILSIDSAKSAGTPAPPRTGRWMSELLKHPDIMKPPTATVERLAYQGRLTLFCAREKAGKSTLLASAAAAVSTGQGYFDGPPQEPGNVLWIGLEEATSDIVQRFMKFGADPNRIYVVTTLRGLDDLIACAEDAGTFALAVVDTFAAYAYHVELGDENDAMQVTAAIQPIMDMARLHGTAWVVSAHSRKGEGGGYRGSTALGASVDMVVEMEESGSDERRFKIKGRFHVPSFTASWDGSRYRVLGGIVNEDQREIDTIIATISARPGLTATAIAGLVGGNTERIKTKLQLLLRTKRIENKGSRSRSELYVNGAVPQFSVPPRTERNAGGNGGEIRSARPLAPPKGGPGAERNLTSHRSEAWDGDEPDTVI